MEPSDSEQVFANDLELRGVYTGPYNAVDGVDEVGPNFAHLPAPRLKTMETATVPGPEALGGPPVHVSPSDSGGSTKGIIAVLALTVLGLGIAFAIKLGVI